MSNLLFSPKSVNPQRHTLARVIRLLFTRLWITEEKFYELHHRFARDQQKAPHKIQSDRGNLKKILRLEDLTWGKFNHAVLDILNLDIVDVTFTLRDNKTKEIYRISNRDTVRDDGTYVSAAPLPEQTESPANPSDITLNNI